MIKFLRAAALVLALALMTACSSAAVATGVGFTVGLVAAVAVEHELVSAAAEEGKNDDF